MNRRAYSLRPLAGVLALAAVACDSPRTVPVAHPAVSRRSSPVRIEVVQRVGYSDADRVRLDAAVQIAAEVINSSDFQRQVLTYGSNRSPSGFSQADRAFSDHPLTSNQEVLDALLAGNAPSDGTIRLFLSMERHPSEIGHTQPTASQTSVSFTDRSAFNAMETADLANHLVHEHLHRVGFLHHQQFSVERCDSIPYAVGQLVCTMAKARGASGACALAVDGKC
jgi:hypothetical protein